MRRVAAIEAERAGIFAHQAIDRVRIHAAAVFLSLAVVPERPEQRGPCCLEVEVVRRRKTIRGVLIIKVVTGHYFLRRAVGRSRDRSGCRTRLNRACCVFLDICAGGAAA